MVLGLASEEARREGRQNGAQFRPAVDIESQVSSTAKRSVIDSLQGTVHEHVYVNQQDRLG